jgi:hypothetical protein
MRIFVPGRICLFGEHSDWAGGYRRINAEIEKGYTLICGTNQGIHADVEPHPTALVLTSTTPDGPGRAARQRPHTGCSPLPTRRVSTRFEAPQRGQATSGGTGVVCHFLSRIARVC